MTNAEAIKQLKKCKSFHNGSYGAALTIAIKALELQTCDDCVSKQAVLKIFDEACYIDGDWYVMREKIEKLPSITPSYNSIKSELEQTRPKGKWKILDECANEGVYCSKCHKTVFKLDFSHTMKWRNFKYCPNCGAKMEVENEKETC